ncbi:hypothetical protein V2J09_020232 [Rumex salicifolius]
MAEQEDQEVKSSQMGSGFSSYSNFQQTHLIPSPIQSNRIGPNSSSSQNYTLSSGLEMTGLFKPKTVVVDVDDHFTIGISDQSLGGPGSTSPNLWQENYQNNSRNNNNRTFFGEVESSIRRVFPCEGNGRPSQGLSLSLSSDNPSSIGLQSFELRQTHQLQGNYRDGFGVKSGFFQQQILVQEGQKFELVRSSNYLGPVQELLNEFCSLEKEKSTSFHGDEIQRQKQARNKEIMREDHTENTNNSVIDNAKEQESLFGLDLIELQKRKKKLIAMLDELNRRYNLYKHQIRSAARQFELAAGAGSASVYTSSASKAMSRHFRCLKDALVSQIKAASAAGEVDGVGGAPAGVEETTPRLKALDQAIRRQKALQQQIGMSETHPWRPQRGLPEKSVSVLRAWLFEHFLHPYPSDVDKHILSRETGLSRSQVSNWFINARVRLWKPMVEEMYLEETKEEPPHSHTAAATSAGGGTHNTGGGGPTNTIPTLISPHQVSMLPPQPPHEDQKPTLDQTLSAIISNPNFVLHDHHHHHDHEGFGGPTSMETLDFSSYNNHLNVAHEGFGLGSVSLTLGLQREGGARELGLGLSYSHVGPHGSVFYPRVNDEMDGHYSLLDEDDQSQNLPYKKLVGAQLLHDFS